MNTKETTITLGIEMSNPSANKGAAEQTHALALWSGENGTPTLLGSAPLAAGTRGSDGIMHGIESLCSELSVEPRSIARIIVSIGPGGYTALRIATTTAKLLASTLGASLIAVPSALVAARSVRADQRPALIALASKKDHTHASVIDADGSLQSVGIITCDALSDLGVRTIVADQHLPESFVLASQKLGIERALIRLDARELIDASAGVDPVDPMRLAPIYAREPDAVTQWRDRASG